MRTKAERRLNMAFPSNRGFMELPEFQQVRRRLQIFIAPRPATGRYPVPERGSMIADPVICGKKEDVARPCGSSGCLKNYTFLNRVFHFCEQGSGKYRIWPPEGKKRYFLFSWILFAFSRGQLKNATPYIQGCCAISNFRKFETIFS